MKALSVDPFYLGKDILDCLVRTDLPEAGHQFKCVSPFTKLYLPKDALVDRFGDSIVVLVIEDYTLWEAMTKQVRHARPNDHANNCILEYMEYVRTIQFQHARLSVHAFTEHGGIITLPLEEKEFSDAIRDHAGVISDDNRMVACNIRRVALNILMLLESYPEYFTKASTSGTGACHGTGFGMSRSRQIHRPRVIGADFNLRSDEVATVTRRRRVCATKATHLRRGHWRRQRFGSGLRRHRLIWVRPVLINS